jgi:putative ABC transport system permease protein
MTVSEGFSLSLAWRLLRRNWRSGELKILSIALILAVAIVSGINVFAERLERSLVAESTQFLGADQIVRSPHPIDSQWISQAQQQGVATALSTQFASMVFAANSEEGSMYLASVKAVSDGYPLRGKLHISSEPFATSPEQIQIAEGVPASGEVWVDSRLLPLLNIELGDAIEIGVQRFRVTKVVISEPDRGDSFSLYGARVLMNQTDLAATQVIQPGSRIRYQWLLAGEPKALSELVDTLEPALSVHQRVLDLESSQRGLATSLDTGRRFLLLAGVIGVLLSGVAIVIAAQRFAERHIEQVALMKSLGASSWKIRWLYVGQLLLLALFTLVVGTVAGDGLQRLVSWGLQNFYPITLAPPQWQDYGIGIVTGLVCLLFFTLPPLWHLPVVPPIKILRREMQVASLKQSARFAWGLLALVLLIGVFSRDLGLTLSVTIGLIVLISVAGLVALLLLKVGRKLGMQVGHVWRFALANLQRQQGRSVMQIIVFATALMLLLSLFSIRNNLLDEWRLQLPPETPNHFLLNIAPYETEALQQLLAEQSVETSTFYPMVRARLIKINNQVPNEDVKQRAEVLKREANLSWTEDLASDNKILQGKWWDQWQPVQGQAKIGVSVEQEIAEHMGLKLGDQLHFSVGGLSLDATVASIRSLEWDSMRPNFYFLFSPGALDDFSPTFLTSIFLNPEQKQLINPILQSHPTVVVIEMDKVISQIQTIVANVSQGVELVLWLVLICGLLVLIAAVHASIDERQGEAGLLRALGSGRRLILGSLWVEFSILGGISGLLAVAGGEALLIGLQAWVLEMPLSFHYGLWIAGPLLGALLIGLVGVLSCYRVVNTPPAVVLRES